MPISCRKAPRAITRIFSIGRSMARAKANMNALTHLAWGGDIRFKQKERITERFQRDVAGALQSGHVMFELFGKGVDLRLEVALVGAPGPPSLSLRTLHTSCV